MWKRLALILPLALAACSSPDGGGAEAPHCAGKCDGAEATPLFVCAPSAGAVECRSALPADLPVEAEINVMTFDGAKLANLTKGEVLSVPVGTQVLATVALSSKQAGLFRSRDDSEALDMINQTFVTTSSAQRFDLPFDLWRLTITSEVFLANATLEAQKLPIAPWQTFLHSLSAVTRPSPELPLVEKGTSELVLLVPRGATSAKGHGQICDSEGCLDNVALSWSGPGAYVLTRSGFARASTPPATDPPATDPPATDPPATDNPDLLPPTTSDPDPSCGGDLQKRCNVGGDYLCDEGFVYSSSDALCHACGKDGELRCLVDGNYVCSDGFVYSSSDARCHVCGKDGELRCLVDGNYVCSDGFVYSSSDARCHTCGADNQPRCLVDSNYVCSDGFVYTSLDNRCHACGAESQPRCFVDGNYVCNDGFAYASSDGHCHAK